MKGEFNIGLVKTKEGQRKKHRLQMTENELDYLYLALKKIDLDKLHISYHLQNKTEVKYDIEDVKKMLLDEQLRDYIIEYNETPLKNKVDKRILIRSNDTKLVKYKREDGTTFKALSNLCVVLSIIDNRIITCYWNIHNDRHDTINWWRYDRELEIIKQ